jgi:Flp pilus assembly protein TadB
MGTDRAKAPSRTDVADTLSEWAVGGGIVTIALFPLALPILALTAVALLPLLVPVIGVGLVAAVVGLPVWVVRRIRRRRTMSVVEKVEVELP